MTNPLISIVINNYNYARYLSQSIESALAQTYNNVEVVVVDDCSTDDSREVIAHCGNRIVAVLHDRNRGQAAAFDSGFRASKGDLIMLLDSDDYLYSNAAATVAAVWSSGCAKIQYRLDLVNATGGKIDTYPAPEIRFDSGQVLPRLLETGRYETTVTSGSTFVREMLQRALPAPEDDFRISADGYLATLAPFFGTVTSVEEPLGAYRQHGNNTWATSVPSKLGDRMRGSLAHDERKYRVLGAMAREHGLTVAPCPGLRDHQHLETRLASLRLDPCLHPYRNDSRYELAVRGVAASWSARTTWSRQGLLAAWFVAVGFSPDAVASRVIAWRFIQVTRPNYVDRLLKSLRRATS